MRSLNANTGFKNSSATLVLPVLLPRSEDSLDQLGLCGTDERADRLARHLDNRLASTKGHFRISVRGRPDPESRIGGAWAVPIVYNCAVRQSLGSACHRQRRR